MNPRTIASLLLAVAFLSPVASAHYLWVSVDQQTKKAAVVNVYFEESPAAGDGHYLDHFIGTSETSVRTLADPNPKPITLKEVKEKDKRWLQTPIADNSPRSVDAYGKFGVYAYGKKKVLLHYYARHLDVRSHDAVHELGRAEHMKLDLVPHDSGDEVELTLLWKGNPVANRMLYVRGPAGFRQNVTTDKHGRATVAPKKPGTYRFRSSVEEATSGEENGEAYEAIRHNITLLMKLPLAG